MTEGNKVDEVFWKKKFIAVQEGISLEDYRGRKNNILVIAPHPDDDVRVVVIPAESP